MRSRRVPTWALLLASLAVACQRSLPVAERIVLVTLDTTRADRLGCYGYPQAETPSLDRLARESVVFEQAVATAPSTLPSHASMLTGMYPLTHGVRSNLDFRLDDGARTVAESLKDAGYATGAFVSSFLLSHSFGVGQGFDVFDEPLLERVKNPREVERIAAATVDPALRWLDQHPAEKVFLWLHLYDPHFPYEPPFPYSARHREEPYDGEIAYVDAQLNRLLDRLRGSPAWDRTLVVVAGDHGEGLYEHGERFHSFLAYESTIHVPLILRFASPRASHVAEAVTLADITPTILDLAGVPAPPGLQGVSLRPSLEGKPLPRRELYFETLAGALSYGWSPLRGIRRGPWKLVDSSEPELYDLAKDPGEQENRFSTEAERVNDLRAALESMESAASAGVASARAAPLAPEVAARLASLGYVSGGLTRPPTQGGPHPRKFMDMEGELLEAQGAVAGGQWKRLEEVCRYVLRRDSKNRFAMYHLAQALHEENQSAEAEGVARELIRLYPTSPAHNDLLGLILISLGRRSEALQVFRAAIQETGGSEPLFYHAALAGLEMGEAGVCESEIPAAVERYPKSWSILVLRARCEAREGDDARALATLRAAVAAGFQDFRLIQGTRDFRRLVSMPAYGELVSGATSKGPLMPPRPQ